MACEDAGALQCPSLRGREAGPAGKGVVILHARLQVDQAIAAAASSDSLRRTPVHSFSGLGVDRPGIRRPVAQRIARPASALAALSTAVVIGAQFIAYLALDFAPADGRSRLPGF